MESRDKEVRKITKMTKLVIPPNKGVRAKAEKRSDFWQPPCGIVAPLEKTHTPLRPAWTQSHQLESPQCSAGCLIRPTPITIPLPPGGPLPQGTLTQSPRRCTPAPPPPPSEPKMGRDCLFTLGPRGRHRRGRPLRKKGHRGKKKNGTLTLEGEQDVCGPWRGKQGC